MAANFRIRFHRYKDILQLKLSGNFDGSSAHELLNFLKKVCKGIRRVVIHTDSLKDIHPFGRNVFHCNLHVLDAQPIRLEFSGVKAVQMLPAGMARENAVVALALANSEFEWRD